MRLEIGSLSISPGAGYVLTLGQTGDGADAAADIRTDPPLASDPDGLGFRGDFCRGIVG